MIIYYKDLFFLRTPAIFYKLSPIHYFYLLNLSSIIHSFLISHFHSYHYSFHITLSVFQAILYELLIYYIISSYFLFIDKHYIISHIVTINQLLYFTLRNLFSFYSLLKRSSIDEFLEFDER